MSNATPHLRYTSPPDERWDPLRFWWGICDAGILRLLRPAEAKVLVQAFRMADRAGEVDLPQRWVADAVGYCERAVHEAIKSLEHRRVLEQIGRSAVSPNTDRYRLITPTPLGNGTPLPIDPLVEVPERRFGSTGTHVPKSLNAASGKEAEKELEKENSSSTPGSARTSGTTLFEPPAYDAAAAAALVFWAGLDKRVAHGLVTQYRPTRRQVLQVVANAAAWRRAMRAGTEKRPLHNPAGFIRAAIRDGHWSLDPRVLDMRDQRRERSRKRGLGLARMRTPGSRAPGSAADRAVLDDQARAVLDRMSPAELQALHDRVLQGVPPATRRWAADRSSRAARGLLLQAVRKGLATDEHR